MPLCPASTLDSHLGPALEFRFGTLTPSSRRGLSKRARVISSASDIANRISYWVEDADNEQCDSSNDFARLLPHSADERPLDSSSDSDSSGTANDFYAEQRGSSSTRPSKEVRVPSSTGPFPTLSCPSDAQGTRRRDGARRHIFPRANGWRVHTLTINNHPPAYRNP